MTQKYTGINFMTEPQGTRLKSDIRITEDGRSILDLMLEAERRECPILPFIFFDFFGIKCDTICEAVTAGIDFDKKLLGEIDAVNQVHYLDGPNYDPTMDFD